VLLAATTTLLLPTTTAAASSPPASASAKRLSTRLRRPQPQPPPLPPSHTVTLAPCAPLPVLSNCSAVPQAFHDNVEACAHISFSAFGQKATTAHLSFVLMGEDEGEEGETTVVSEVEAVLEDIAGEERIEKQSSSGGRGSSSGDDGKRRALEAADPLSDVHKSLDIESTKSDNNGNNAVVLRKDADSESSGTTLTMVLLVGSVFYFPTQAEMYEFMQVRKWKERRGANGGDWGAHATPFLDK